MRISTTHFVAVFIIVSWSASVGTRPIWTASLYTRYDSSTSAEVNSAVIGLGTITSFCPKGVGRSPFAGNVGSALSVEDSDVLPPRAENSCRGCVEAFVYSSWVECDVLSLNSPISLRQNLFATSPSNCVAVQIERELSLQFIALFTKRFIPTWKLQVAWLAAVAVSDEVEANFQLDKQLKAPIDFDSFRSTFYYEVYKGSNLLTWKTTLSIRSRLILLTKLLQILTLFSRYVFRFLTKSPSGLTDAIFNLDHNC